MKVAIVHYWLVGMRGGEKVVEGLCRLFPEADIFTHVYRPDRICETIRRHRITTTLISRLPFATTRYQSYLPLMPFALEQLDLQEYDLVISSESGPAKGVLTRPDALHVCYCHTPMRVLETVVPEETGVLFQQQTADALIAAIEHFEAIEPRFDPAAIRAHAAGFSEDVFLEQMSAHLDHWLAEHQRRLLPVPQPLRNRAVAAIAA